MTAADNTIPPAKSIFSVSRLLWIILIVATLFVCYFRNLGTIGLVGPDEPRYAWIARDVAESGDWITPRLYGQPWFEKPVLYYWGAALSFKLFGVSEVTARLPSAICALVATLAMAWLAWRAYGAETARWLLLLLPTTVGMVGFSHAAATDMPFAATLSLALVSAATILGLTRSPDDTPILPRTPWLALILFGFFLGLAVLAKGPAAIILMGGALLLWAALTQALFAATGSVISSQARKPSSIADTPKLSPQSTNQSRPWRRIFRLLHPVAILSFCLTALPWYILCAQRNPDFFRIFIIEHNFKRYLTPEFQHIQPFWFYLPILLIAFAPWTVLLVCSVGSGIFHLAQSRRLSPIPALLLSWSVFCIVFFSISQSKLPGYILPAIPAIGLLLAQSYVCLVPRSGKLFQWLLIVFSLSTTLVGFLLLRIFGRSFLPHRISPAASASIGWLLLGFALANLLLCLRERQIAARLNLSSLSVVPILVLVLLFPQLASPWVAVDPSGKSIAQDLIEIGIPLDQVFVWEMNRGQEYSLNFYLHRELQNWNKNNPGQGYVLFPPKTGGFISPARWRCAAQSKALRTSGWFLCRVERATGE